jgi:predicted AlkP superfamily phosphohydrolase/phosphomutase
MAGARAAALTMFPRPLARRVKQRLPRDTEDRHFEQLWHESVDWARTRAYAEGEPGHSFVRVSRSFSGDRESLLKEIAGELRLLENADSGRPAIVDVIDVRKRIPGPHADVLPDLAVAWALDGMLERIRHPRIGVIEEDLRDLPPSEHTEEGFVIAAGPGIRAQDAIGTGHIVDLAPTLLHLAGAPVPREMDGSPLDLLDPKLGEPHIADIEMGDDPWR